MEDILNRISDCIVNMDEENIEKLVLEAVDRNNIKVEDIFLKGLNDGMHRAIELFEEKEYHLPEVIVCADTLSKGIEVLKGYGQVPKKSKGKIVFSVVKCDTHEIGKNIVKILLEASGFEVIDMGVNRDTKDIIDMALKEEAEIIALSSMITTTMGEMGKLINELNQMKLENKPFVIIGGGCITRNYAVEIGADGYAENAPKAVKLVQSLLRGVNN